MKQVNCKRCGEISPVCYCECVECDKPLQNELGDLVCSECQEILDGNI